MHLDPVLLSRLQFVWVIAWHILLPAFTVGLSSYVAVLEGLHLATAREIYLRLSNFWIRIFAVSFGMGVVSGIVMPFQFGTNWSRFSDATADVLSPLLAYEVLTAFFLEAAFLGILLRQFLRLLYPLLALHRARAGRGLQSAWGRVADPEDGRRLARLGACGRAALFHGGARRYRRRQPVDTIRKCGDRRALVHLSQYPLSLARASAHARYCGMGMACSEQSVGSGPFRGRGSSLSDVLSRDRDQPLADDRAARYSLWDAASAPATQAFLLIGTLILLPIILLYTGWSYWVFRGKVHSGYH